MHAISEALQHSHTPHIKSVKLAVLQLKVPLVLYFGLELTVHQLYYVVAA
jgi:hypothetical protein